MIAIALSIALAFSSPPIDHKITGYCPCEICTGKTDGITSSGTRAVEGITVAADNKLYPPGTILAIDGLGLRVVEDTGVKGRQIDVFYDTHREALIQSNHKYSVVVLYKPQKGGNEIVETFWTLYRERLKETRN